MTRKYTRKKALSRICEYCGCTYEKPPKTTHEYWEIRKYCTPNCGFEVMKGKKGSGTNHWMGDSIGYSGIHQWILKTYGKASKCEGVEGTVCKQHPNFEWAVIHEKGYARDRSHFKELCKSCHRWYDHPDNRKFATFL